MTPALLTLSVVSHGHGVLLGRLLGQLDTEPALAGLVVIVTLNQAGESFDPALYPRLRIEVIRNARPRGFGANHNAAFRRCLTTWFGVINPDLALCDGEPFTRMLERAAQHARVGVVAPRVVTADGEPEDSVRANLTLPSLLARHLLLRRSPLDVRRPARQGEAFYWLAGMCLLLDARAYASVGGFDEGVFLYCEDFDLCARLYNEGYAITFDSSVQIVHDAQRDSHRSLRHLRWHIASLFRVWLSAAFWRVTVGRGSVGRAASVR